MFLKICVGEYEIYREVIIKLLIQIILSYFKRDIGVLQVILQKRRIGQTIPKDGTQAKSWV